MYCSMCDNEKPLKPKSVTKKYDESGLDNITLKGVIEFKCPKCGEVYYNYSNFDQLHELIARHLIRKRETLSSSEIRFLRKYMGYSSKMFAKLVGQKFEHISRIENGRSKITPLLDHFVRCLVIQKFPDRNYDLHDHILNDSGEKFSRLEARFDRDGWNIKTIA